MIEIQTDIHFRDSNKNINKLDGPNITYKSNFGIYEPATFEASLNPNLFALKGSSDWWLYFNFSSFPHMEYLKK